MIKKMDYKSVNKLLTEEYKAELIDKKKFKELLYGFNRNDISDKIDVLTEGLIKSENTKFYLINDVEVLNKNCRCINPSMYPEGKVLPLPLSMFYPYILLALEISDDGGTVNNYAKWGSFDDNIYYRFSELENFIEKN